MYNNIQYNSYRNGSQLVKMILVLLVKFNDIIDDNI